MLVQRSFEFSTPGPGAQDITEPICDWVAESKVDEALLTLFLQHTSASLLIMENYDPEVMADMERFLRRLAPPGDPLFRHQSEGPDDMPAHVRTALTQTTLSVPVAEGRPALGTWQGIWLYEHRDRPHRRRLLAQLLAMLLLCVGVSGAQAQPSEQAVTPTARTAEEVGIRRVFDQLKFERPLWIGHPEDGSNRLFVGQQNGQIFWFNNVHNVRRMHEAVDLRARVRRRHNEEGLLGIAFHPSGSGEVFLHYSASDPRRNVVSRFRMDDARERILLESEEIVLELEQPWGNHNGGDLRFGPDGYLYVSFGDGGGANDPQSNGQDLSNWFATILRIDVDSARPYAVPDDNPFVGTEGALPEIYAYGLRNVWRMSFDRETGELWAGDVGQDRWEEIDRIVAGGNYGWNHREGSHAFRGHAIQDQYVEPVIDYDRRQAQCITGGYVYRGRELPPLLGAYVHADYTTGFVWALWAEGDRVTRHITIGRGSEIASFGEDLAGELYFCSFDGAIYRLAGPIR